MTVRSLLRKIKWTVFKTKNHWSDKKRAKAAMEQFYEKVGYRFDINNPQLFTEKVVWYKLFYKRNDLVKIVDKCLFKSYVREKLGEGYTVPLYGVWDSIDSLKNDWEKLPKEFVLKSTVMGDSKGVRIIRNKNEVNLQALFDEVSRWFLPQNTLIHSFCWAYYAARPRIIAEEYMKEIDGQLYDYKFLCFDGVPHYAYAYKNRFADGPEIREDFALTHYDLEWNKQDVIIAGNKIETFPKPVHLNEMIEISKKLSAGLPFVRVDFYEFRNRIYVGEMTLYPDGGFSIYEPVSFNKKLGDLFHLPMNCGGGNVE